MTLGSKLGQHGFQEAQFGGSIDQSLVSFHRAKGVIFQGIVTQEGVLQTPARQSKRVSWVSHSDPPSYRLLSHLHENIMEATSLRFLGVVFIKSRKELHQIGVPFQDASIDLFLQRAHSEGNDDLILFRRCRVSQR
jgi:hypothetical protein